ncbi:hypothetical protein RND71_009317 [Anisodus tanguticus]|uniref:Calcineurin-like phosphoesterase domain-containing protein n=1 Tax=Anisodus tanguticus TaxID=243964 RepID=A0AAE1SI22_9SOLA|nr:hypothetical protein RND71_009317 [Anisodus tanguticus]
MPPEECDEHEPGSSGAYVLMGNAYAASGRWGDFAQVRKKMKERNVKKCVKATRSLGRLPSAIVGKLPMTSSIRIAVVGDVHDDWNLEEDMKALQLLKPLHHKEVLRVSSYCPYSGLGSIIHILDRHNIRHSEAGVVKGKGKRWRERGREREKGEDCLPAFIGAGDFGNENVDVVRSIADLEITKAVILGNHDAWNTQKFSRREKDAVQLQLERLGDEHVGYRRMDLPMLKLSIVGGRPFSCGCRPLFRKQLLKARYGVSDMDGSAERILQAAMDTPEDHSIIFLAHNGPTGGDAGLGANVDDICGRDWFVDGGDHGDPDLAQALAKLKAAAPYPVPLVIFGDMHKQLASGNGFRKMIVVGNDNTIYLNGTIVPRVRPPALTAEFEGTSRDFTVAEVSNGRVEKIAETWISVLAFEVELDPRFILYMVHMPQHLRQISHPKCREE